MKIQRYILGLALVVGLWACENAGDVTTPQLQPESGASLVRKVEKKGGARFVTESDFAVGSVSGEIGPQGGQLNLANRVILDVPKGAVQGKTLFTIEKVEGEQVVVALTATSTKKNSERNNVGRQGFRVPLMLTFRYSAEAAAAGDVGALKVLYLVQNGTVQEQPTVVDAGVGEVTGEIRHFSPYGVGWHE